MMKKPVKKSERVINEICQRLEEGRTMTSICQDDGMPTLRAVNNWRRNDEEAFDKLHRAYVVGLQTRIDRRADKANEIVTNPNDYNKQTIHAVAGILRDQNVIDLKMLSSLDRRFTDKKTVEHSGNTPMILSDGKRLCRPSSEPALDALILF